MSKEPTIQAYLNGKVTYDKDGQYFWITANNDMKMLAELRGWGSIQYLFKDKSGIIDEHLAAKFQDEIGEFIAEAINEKIEKLKNKPL